MSVLLIIAIIAFIIIAIRFYEKTTNALCKSQRRLDGQVTVVTGGTAGMGLEIAKEFARRGAKVYIACPFKQEGTDAEKEIIEQTGNKNVIFKLMDLSSINSIRKFAADIYKDEERLDILVNNAGVGVPKDFITEDGMSFIMQVNYFGHFLLTLLLLPLMKKTGKYRQPSRIVNTSSIMHMIGAYDINNFNRCDHWLMAQIYAKSKFALILFARELTKKLKGTDNHVVINCVDPGGVGTGIFNSTGKINGVLLTNFFSHVYKTPWEGAQTALHVSLDHKAGEVSGEFFKNCKQSRAVPWAYSDKLASDVWKQSVKCVNLSEDELAKCLA